MNDTVYWAVKLDEANKSKLLASIPPVHPNIYAEHVTIIFKPTDDVNNELMKVLGNEVSLSVIGCVEDTKGQAVVVDSSTIKRIGGGIPHITISCAVGIKPFYSNSLVAKGYNKISPIELTGKISRFTNSGWES